MMSYRLGVCVYVCYIWAGGGAGGQRELQWLLLLVFFCIFMLDNIILKIANISLYFVQVSQPHDEAITTHHIL